MAEKISMKVDETLELDYLVEQINSDAANIKTKPDNVTTSLNYIKTESTIFNPPDSGTYEIEISGQIITVEVIDIPDSTLTQDLIAWYRFEDGDARDYTATLDAQFADTTAYDATVNNATYQSTGGVTDVVKETESGGFSFTGGNTNEYLSLDATTVNGLSDYTISLWVKNPTSGEYYLSLANSNTDNEMIFGSNLDATGWKHCVVTRENGTGNAYVNASSNNSFLYNNRYGSNPLDVDQGGFIIGQEQDSVGGGFVANQAHEGNIDDIRIYNRALTQSEISDIYNNTKP